MTTIHEGCPRTAVAAVPRSRATRPVHRILLPGSTARRLLAAVSDGGLASLHEKFMPATQTPTAFEKGDRVRHSKRPEWGTGIVRDVQKINHEGTPAQRLTIDFAVKGRAVLNTALAPLERRGPAAARGAAGTTQAAGYSGSASQLWAGHPDQQESARQPGVSAASVNGRRRRSADDTDSGSEDDWLGELEGKATGTRQSLHALPEALTDPFATPVDRLRATLETYRFTNDPKGLLDWAAAQTGHDDPLSHHTRTELEEAYPKFVREREQHLRALVKDMKRNNGMRKIKSCMKGGLRPAAQSALDKAIRA